VLHITAALWGIDQCIFALRGQHSNGAAAGQGAPRWDPLPVFGLTTASFVTWCDHWR
jgi:hypothetical protein